MPTRPTYRMTFAETTAPDEVLNAFVGDRWHSTAELAAATHYALTHIRRTLNHLVRQGKVEKSFRYNGLPAFWRIPPVRHCDNCGTDEPLNHFYRDYRRGTETVAFYPGCKATRKPAPARRKTPAAS